MSLRRRATDVIHFNANKIPSIGGPREPFSSALREISSQARIAEIFLLTHLRRKCDFNVADLCGEWIVMPCASTWRGFLKTSLPGEYFTVFRFTPFSDGVKKVGGRNNFPQNIFIKVPNWMVRARWRRSCKAYETPSCGSREAVTFRRYFAAKLLYFFAAHASISCYFWTCDAEMSWNGTDKIDVESARINFTVLLVPLKFLN